MQGKSRSCLIGTGIVETLYGLSFVCMGVACSYLRIAETSYNSWSDGNSGSGGGMAFLQRGDDMSAFAQPHSPPVRRDTASITSIRKDLAGHGTWLAILYTVTGFLGIVGGQENDRIIPLLHTILALVCIAWAPLMFEMLYLLIRPSSMYAYTFLNEMDLITSQKHWVAYVISICVVVAGSALYLFSAALAAYQYGVRMIERPARNANLQSASGGNGASAPPIIHSTAQKSTTTLRLHEPKKPEPSPSTTVVDMNETRTSPTSKPRTMNHLQLTLPINSTDATSDGDPKFIKHSRTDAPLHTHQSERAHGYGHSTSASMTLPRTQSKTARNPNPGDRRSVSRQDLDRQDGPGRSPRDYDEREMDRRGGYNSVRRYGDRGGRPANSTQVYGLGHYYDDAAEAIV